MSTGADCTFIEVKPGQWAYRIQRWPYGENPDYDQHGPFQGFAAARRHLDSNYANPGGWDLQMHPDHVHEWEQSDWVRIKAGVTVTLDIKSLGPDPSPEAVLERLSRGDLTTDHLTITPLYGRGEGFVCTSCGEERS